MKLSRIRSLRSDAIECRGSVHIYRGPIALEVDTCSHLPLIRHVCVYSIANNKILLELRAFIILLMTFVLCERKWGYRIIGNHREGVFFVWYSHIY